MDLLDTSGPWPLDQPEPEPVEVEPAAPAVQVCPWQASMVTLADGTQVASDSEPWRAQCEAYHLLAMPHAKREACLGTIAQRRGEEGMPALRNRLFDLEPAFVLDLPNKAQRNAYVDQVAFHRGQNAADHLRYRAEQLHAERKARTGT